MCFKTKYLADRWRTSGYRCRRLIVFGPIFFTRSKHPCPTHHPPMSSHSRRVKKNLRARKRFVVAERRAGRIAQTMDTKELVEALRQRGRSSAEEGSEELDLERLQRVYVEGIQSEMRVRLHASSRYGPTRKRPTTMANTQYGRDLQSNPKWWASTSLETPADPSPPSPTPHEISRICSPSREAYITCTLDGFV